MNHEEYEALISAQLDGELTADEKSRLSAHLAACPQCRQMQKEFLALQAGLLSIAAEPPAGLAAKIVEGLESQPVTVVPQKSRVGRRVAPWLAAAAMVALVFLGVVHPGFPFGGSTSEAPTEMCEEVTETTEAAMDEPEEEAWDSQAEGVTPDETAQAPQTQAQTHSGSTGTTQNSMAASDRPPSEDTAVPSDATGGSAGSGGSAPQAPVASETTEAPAVRDSKPTAEPPEDAKWSDTIDGYTAEDAPDEVPHKDVPLSDESHGLTWQEAMNALTAYLRNLGQSDPAVTPLGLSADGTSWLFSSGGGRYAVDRETGQITVLSSP